MDMQSVLNSLVEDHRSGEWSSTDIRTSVTHRSLLCLYHRHVCSGSRIALLLPYKTGHCLILPCLAFAYNSRLGIYAVSYNALEMEHRHIIDTKKVQFLGRACISLEASDSATPVCMWIQIYTCFVNKKKTDQKLILTNGLPARVVSVIRYIFPLGNPYADTLNAVLKAASILVFLFWKSLWQKVNLSLTIDSNRKAEYLAGQYYSQEVTMAVSNNPPNSLYLLPANITAFTDTSTYTASCRRSFPSTLRLYGNSIPPATWLVVSQSNLQSIIDHYYRPLKQKYWGPRLLL